jgi:hypothetical protein
MEGVFSPGGAIDIIKWKSKVWKEAASTGPRKHLPPYYFFSSKSRINADYCSVQAKQMPCHENPLKSKSRPDVR